MESACIAIVLVCFRLLRCCNFTLFVWLLFPNKNKQDSLTSLSQSAEKVVSLSSVLSLVLVPIWASNNQTFSLYLSNEGTSAGDDLSFDATERCLGHVLSA